MTERTTALTVCALDELAPGTARKVDLDGTPVAVVRIGDQVYAIGDTCSHGAVSLSEGEVLEQLPIGDLAGGLARSIADKLATRSTR